MAWIAVDKDGKEIISPDKPERDGDIWSSEVDVWETSPFELEIPLPKGSIKKLIGQELTWNDEPVELI